LKVEKSEVLKVTREDIVGAEEVEKVIGEKSFEVIEGETEESRDLMSVREKDESTTQTEAQVDTDKETKETEVEKPVVVEKPKKTVKPRPKADQPMAEKKVAKPRPTADHPQGEKKAEKPVEEKSEEDEADRIKKLDEKLDELLKDDL
jgi:hypothetical protein